MFCCGGADEEPAGPPANQYAAPPNKAGNPNFGGKFPYFPHPFLAIYVPSFTIRFCVLRVCIGGNRGEPRNPNAPRSGAPAKVLPIEIPSVALDELNRMAGNFGNKALIGEGSYGRVFYGKFKGEAVAIKKLDASSSEEPDSDFTSQVHTNVTKLIILLISPIKVSSLLAENRSFFNLFSLPLGSNVQSIYHSVPY